MDEVYTFSPARYSGGQTPTKDNIRSIVEEVATVSAHNYVGKDVEQLLSYVQNEVLHRLHYNLPAGWNPSFTEEDEDIQVVRQIHEETHDFIGVPVFIDMPVKYLVLHINEESVDARLGIKFYPYDRPGDASGTGSGWSSDAKGT
jgi:hypothetical protein